MACTRHRVFLATLIVAAKYLNDSGPKNVNWTKYARHFEMTEINLMEKQLLYLLDYDLRFDETEACRHFAPFMRGGVYSKATRQSAVSRVAKGSKARAAAAQLPPTPPPTDGAGNNAVPPSLRNFASDICSTHLSIPSPTGVPRHHRSPSHYHQPATTSAISTASTDSSAASSMYRGCSTDSEDVGSLTEDNGSCSSSADSASEAEAEDLGTDQKRPFVLRPVPTSAYRRKSSANGPAPPQMSGDRSPTSPCPSRINMNLLPMKPLRLAPRPGATCAASKQRSSSAATIVPDKSRATSATLPAVASAPTITKAPRDGFLSRVWGIGKLATVSVPEIAHSRSIVFRRVHQRPGGRYDTSDADAIDTYDQAGLC